MARTTSEAEGADEADATTRSGMDAPSQAEGDVGDTDDPNDAADERA